MQLIEAVTIVHREPINVKFSIIAPILSIISTQNKIALKTAKNYQKAIEILYKSINQN